MDEGFDKQKLVQDFANLLAQMESAVRGAGSPAPQGAPGKSPEEHYSKGTIDSFTDYEELNLEDGRILRRYDSGAVRVENPKRGIIQEDRADGGLIISLPNGMSDFPGISRRASRLPASTLFSSSPGRLGDARDRKRRSSGSISWSKPFGSTTRSI